MARRRRRRRLPPFTDHGVLQAVHAMPRITSEIGFQVAGRPGAKVEVLPGSPGLVVFSSRGRLQGLVMAPMSEDSLRRVLGLPVHPPRDRFTDEAWELNRRFPVGDPPS